MADENKKVELTDPELEQVAAGYSRKDYDIYDTHGRRCGGWDQLEGYLYYWPCKKCGRPTHIANLVHNCGTCDDWFWGIDDTPWPGTEEELQMKAGWN